MTIRDNREVDELTKNGYKKVWDKENKKGNHLRGKRKQ
jgi:hypothetical protein